MPPNNYYRNNNYRGGRNNYRGRGGGCGNYNAAPAPSAVQTPGGIPPAPTYGRNNSNRGAQPPNPNKYYNNQNYCFSCGYDIPLWHTIATCNNQRPHHQVGCTRQNVAQYEAAGHACSKRGIHKTIMPTNPTPEQA